MASQPKSVASRALLSVALLGGFYLLGFVLLLGLVILNVVVAQLTDRVYLVLVLATLGVAAAIVRSLYHVVKQSKIEIGGTQLNQLSESELIEFINGIARELDTQAPDEVYLQPGVNAAVMQTPAFLGLGKGSRVMLIGLGLMEQLTVEELRAVLAHEFGHYTGGDTRLGPLTYRVTETVTRSVSHMSGLTGAIFVWYALLVMRTSAGVRRRQEFAADAAAAELSGSDTITMALSMTEVAGIGFDRFIDTYVVPVWGEGAQPDDLYAGYLPFIAERSVRDAIREYSDRRPPSPYDSHPTIPERAAAVQGLGKRGRHSDDRPCTALLQDLAFRRRQMTDQLAKDALGRVPEKRIQWDELAERIFQPAIARMAGQTADVIRKTKQGEPTVEVVIDLLAKGKTFPVANAITSLKSVPADQLKSVSADILQGPIYAFVGAAMASHSYSWRVTWKDGLQLMRPDRTPVKLDALVRDALFSEEGALTLGRELIRAGVPGEWVPAPATTS